jgi:hypothetical protein
MDIPFTNDQITNLGTNDVKILRLSNGSAQYLKLVPDAEYLLPMDSIATTYSYLNSLYPRLTQEQRSKLGLH